MADGALVFPLAILWLLVRGRVEFHTLLGGEGFPALVADERVMIDHNVIAGDKKLDGWRKKSKRGNKVWEKRGEERRRRRRRKQEKTRLME